MFLRVAIFIVFAGLIAKAVEAQGLKGFACKANAAYLSTPGLNSTLNNVAPEQPLYNSGFFMTGLDAYYRSGRAIIMASAHGGAPAKNVRNSTLNSFAWMVNASFGWILYSKPATWIYPSVGFGSNGLNLNQHVGSNSEVMIKHLNAPSIDVSLHYDHLIIDRYPDRNRSDGILFGLRVGYNATLLQKDWAIDVSGRSVVINSKDLKGGYVTVSFGGLGFFKGKYRR